MKSFVLIGVLAAVAGVRAQEAQVAGVWTAQFQGSTFVRLELRSADGALTGALGLGEFQLDAQGVVRGAASAPGTLTPITDVIQRGSTVSFSRRDNTDTDRFEFRLLNGNRAELQLVLSDEDREELAAEGIPIPKPIPLAR